MSSPEPFHAAPGFSQSLDGAATGLAMGETDLYNLLGRVPVELDADSVRADLAGKVVMVTGAAGSIGSELCRQILRCAPRKLICVDQSETPLFYLQRNMLADAAADSPAEIVYSITDIIDTGRMREQMIEHSVQAIFHAAAYKHVPILEANPCEGLKNNVFGLLDLVEAAEECGCNDFLLISSDKAVNPSSLMGCTKRLGEMIVGSRLHSRMRCVSVRFGNVLGSQGSVFPTFQEQIRSGHAVTVTHPEMTRYFMTISEAVGLTLQAFTIGEQGNILVLDMGKPVRILELARALIRLSGKTFTEVPIIFTGVRPGEKLFEELFYDSEVRCPTSLSRVMRAQSDLPEIRYHLQELRIACQPRFPGKQDAIRTKLKEIIPEYQWEAPPPAPSTPSNEAGVPAEQPHFADTD